MVEHGAETRLPVDRLRTPGRQIDGVAPVEGARRRFRCPDLLAPRRGTPFAPRRTVAARLTVARQPGDRLAMGAVDTPAAHAEGPGQATEIDRAFRLGLAKVRAGVTTVEEVLRVTREVE
jgi:hypothetical protein